MSCTSYSWLAGWLPRQTLALSAIDVFLDASEETKACESYLQESAASCFTGTPSLLSCERPTALRFSTICSPTLSFSAVQVVITRDVLHR